MSNTAIQRREKANVNVPSRTEGAQQQRNWYTPLVDVIETSEAFIFQADLPGVRPADVDVSYENGTLTIEAAAQPRQPEGQAYIWQEYGVGGYHRSFSLNTPIDPEGIKAQLKNGVLELYVPKSEKARTKKIEIQGS